MEQSVSKRRYIQFRRQTITQKKAYKIQNTAEVWNQENIYLTASNESSVTEIISIFTAQIRHVRHVGYL